MNTATFLQKKKSFNNPVAVLIAVSLTGLWTKKNMDLSTPVFLLHGLGPECVTGHSLAPLELYLTAVMGLTNTHRLRYPVNTSEFEETVTFVDKEMQKVVEDREEWVVLIGQSMGGVVANQLHKKGWKVLTAIYIGSPLHGARLLGQLKSWLPVRLTEYLMKKPYKFLMEKERAEEPTHPYNTISMAWPFTAFDGCVYRDEATLHEDHHIHLSWADHRTVFLNPRLWRIVGKLLPLQKNEE